MKILLTIFLVFFSLPSFSQSLSIPSPGSNQERLEDIEDELRRMRRNQLLDEMRRDESIRRNNPQNSEPKNKGYVNTQTYEQRIKNSKFYNLSLDEYLIRDTFSNIECERFYDGKLELWGICYQSKMINISTSEYLSRREKARKRCYGSSNINDSESKQLQCVKNIMVLGK
jgi:hypothetical protein